MEQRNVTNHQELHLLTVETVLNQKEPFTLAEIVEKILNNPLFNNFCSTVELTNKVSESLDVLMELDLIECQTKFLGLKIDKYVVSNIYT